MTTEGVILTVFHVEHSCYLDARGVVGEAPLVIGSYNSGARLTTQSVAEFVKSMGFDSKKGTLTTESKSWAVDPKTGVKKALTSNGEWFDTFEFGAKNGIAANTGEKMTPSLPTPWSRMRPSASSYRFLTNKWAVKVNTAHTPVSPFMAW